MSGLLSRETFAKITNPLANALLRAGFTRTRSPSSEPPHRWLRH